MAKKRVRQVAEAGGKAKDVELNSGNMMTAIPTKSPKRVFERLRNSSAAIRALQLCFVFLGSPGFVLSMAGAAVVIFAKIHWRLSEEQIWAAKDVAPLSLVQFDIIFFFAVAVVATALENAWNPLKILTGFLCWLLVVVSLVNAILMEIMGSQLGLNMVKGIVDNFRQNFFVATGAVGATRLAEGICLLFAPVAIPIAIHFLERRVAKPPRYFKWTVTAASVLILAVFSSIAAFSARPKLPEAAMMAKNVHLTLALDLFSKSKSIGPSKQNVPVVNIAQVDNSKPRRNVVVIFLESSSHLYSSFGLAKKNSTPFLREIAAKGLLADNMRIVMPHTTKSLTSALCGQYPSMKNELEELADNFPVNCLPKILGELGYSSAFFQSSNGEFEGRPRLVDKMGFKAFFPRQLIDSEEISYVNGDDFSMIKPSVDWIMKQGEPFMLTYLTSLNHTPYMIPSRMGRPDCKGRSKSCDLKRYLQTYRATDDFVRQLFDEMKKIGVFDNTVFVISGDHGEGFGEHGARSHDNVYFDEGLKVPYVVLAPAGLIAPGTVVEEPRSIIDTVPTVLSLLEIPFDPDSVPGVTLLKKQPDRTKRYFSCWYDGYCLGYVENDRKVVYMPNTNNLVAFDLSKDPKETKPDTGFTLPPDEMKNLTEWGERHNSHLTMRTFAKKKLFDIWKCDDQKSGNCSFDSLAYIAIKQNVSPNGINGLSATYYARRNFQGRGYERKDYTIDFLWGHGSPMPPVPRNRFSARWQGCLDVKPGESPILAAGADDELLVYVDGEFLVNKEASPQYREVKAKRGIGPGFHQIAVEFTESGANARAFLGWSLKGEEPVAIPYERLFPLGENSERPCLKVEIDRKEGLTAKYYSELDFKKKEAERVDRNIEFDWQNDAPIKEVPDDEFSVRWQGCIFVDKGESPTLVVGANDKLSIYLDDALVFDSGDSQNYETGKAEKPIEPGIHRIRVDFQNSKGSAKVFLGWLPAGAKVPQIIPVTRLVPIGGNSIHPCPPS